MKRVIFLGFSILIIIANVASSQSFNGYQWNNITCTGEPVARHEAAFIEANGNIYAVGVQTGNYPHETSLKETYVYKPATNIWEKSFNMPEGRVRASTTAKVYKDKLYVACGIIDGHWEGHVKWFDCYDFKTGKWSTLADPVPTQRAGCTAIAIGDKIIFTGGESMSQIDAHNQVEYLGTKTGKWSKLPSLNTGRHGTQLIWYKRKMYIASGCGHRGGAPELKSIECFSKK